MITKEPIISGLKWTGKFMAQEVINKHNRYFLSSPTELGKKTGWKAKLTPLAEFAVITLWVITVLALVAIWQ